MGKPKPPWFTSDRVCPPGFAKKLGAYDPRLECCWDQRFKRWVVIEQLDQPQRGAWWHLVAILGERDPIEADLRVIAESDKTRYDSPSDAYKKLIGEPNRQAEKSKGRAQRNVLESIVDDNARQLAAIPQFSLGGVGKE